LYFAVVYIPGQSGNPNGRPAGSRNKQTAAILRKRFDAGHQDLGLSELFTKTQDESIKIAAGTALSNFFHAKWAAVPLPRYIETPVDLPKPTTVVQATDNIATIESLVASGQMDFDSARDLVAMNESVIRALTVSDLEVRVNQAFENHGLPPLLDQMIEGQVE
jgi:hypothetical protein